MRRFQLMESRSMVIRFALRSGNTVKISGEIQLKNVASNLRLIDVAVCFSIGRIILRG